MFNRVFYYLFVVSILFTGCSTVTNIDKPTTKVAQVDNKVENDELDEFSDEFADDEVEEQSDPLRSYNIFMTKFNDRVYIEVFNPLATSYSNTVPQDVRKSVRNFFNNLLYPVRLVNNIFQGKFKNAGEETGRFVINTTVGILGLFDPAKEYFELEAHNEDFGQTLGYWGVGSGYHIVLPFFGPSNMRDMFSMYPDSMLNPVMYSNQGVYNIVQNEEQSLALTFYQKLNNSSLKLGEYETLRKDAVDLYPFFKDIYEQHREKLIKE